MIPRQHIAFGSQTHKQMDDPEKETEHQKLHGIVQRSEPQGRHSDFSVEKRFRHHRDHVPEIAAEHHAPEYVEIPQKKNIRSIF